MTGIVLGLTAAALFALGSICSRLGMRSRQENDGLFLSVLVNVVLLGLLIPGVRLPAWNWAAIVSFILAGALGTLLGRGTSLRAIRRIGTARSNAFQISNPLFTAMVGWFVLDERVRPVQGLGGAMIVGGLALVIRSRAASESLVTATEPMPRTPRSDGKRGLSFIRGVFTESPRRVGLLYAVISPVFFGLGFVARKWGILHFESPVAGAFLGTLTSLTVVVTGALLGRRLRSLIDENFRYVPWWFVATGMLTGTALILQFNAFVSLQAWMVSLLQGTQGLWTLLWGFLFLREDERISGGLVLAVLLIMAGVAVMSLGR